MNAPPQPATSYAEPADLKMRVPGLVIAATGFVAVLAFFLFLQPAMLPYLLGVTAGNEIQGFIRRLQPNTDIRRANRPLGRLGGMTFHWSVNLLLALMLLVATSAAANLLQVGLAAQIAQLSPLEAVTWATPLVLLLVKTVWPSARNAFAPHPTLGPPA